MRKCACCGTGIFIGGRKVGDLDFCSSKCASNAQLIQVASQVPDDMLDEYVRKVHEGQCPHCKGKGPVDVHMSHQVWSALLLTSWKSKQKISCKSCGIKSQFAQMFISLLFGWWGFPWGLIMTPVQIIRNVVEMMGGPSPLRPSDKLRFLLRLNMAQIYLDKLKEERKEPEAVPA